MRCYTKQRFKFKQIVINYINSRTQNICSSMDVNEIFFLGHNKYGQAGSGEQEHNKKYTQPKSIVFKTFIKQVSCGNHHSALLTIDGLIYTMGSNIHGTLGLGNIGNINYAFKPTLVKDIQDVDQVVSGSYHMCAIKQGELYTWGKGIDGQLGHGNMKNVFIPTKVQSLGNQVQSVSCGLNHTLVIVNNKTNTMNGYSFGSGIYGQLGCGINRNFNHPVNIKLSNIESVSAGENHSLFISEGRLYGCGDNSYFQLGQFEDSLRSKKYILEPVRLEFCSDEISLIDCHNLSIVLSTKGAIFIWGGKSKLWPPVTINQPQVINLKVSNEKIYYINSKNELVSLTFNQQKPQTQIILTNKNVLDMDCGENHLFAVGDIVAQTQQKTDQSYLSQWKGQSLTTSMKSFSQKNINKTSTKKIQNQLPINQQIPEFYFTMHLKSGMSEDPQQQSQKSQSQFQSAQQFDQSANQSANETFKTFENISSSIEMQSRYPLQINESDTKNGFVDQKMPKYKQKIISASTVELKSFNQENKSQKSQTRKYSQMKLQKLMDEMQQKTIHLKKNYPEKNNAPKYPKSIIKTPSSYIKKQPQNFVIASQQFRQNNFLYENPKISQFDQKIPVGLVLQQDNFSKFSKQNNAKNQSLNKNISKQSITYSENRHVLQNSEYNNQKKASKAKEIVEKEDEQSIENIFMQLLRKQKQKTSNKKSSDNIYQTEDSQQLPKRRKRLSHSCLSSKYTQQSTSRAEKETIEPKIPIQTYLDRSPINQTKMAVSKISQHSNISAKTNFKKNTELLEISRSNRQLRFQLRDRNLKISQLQEELSKKQIEVQMLYQQLQYFRNSSKACQNCGNRSRLSDPFSSN